jgi:hypothetical protein
MNEKYYVKKVKKVEQAQEAQYINSQDINKKVKESDFIEKSDNIYNNKNLYYSYGTIKPDKKMSLNTGYEVYPPYSSTKTSSVKNNSLKNEIIINEIPSEYDSALLGTTNSVPLDNLTSKQNDFFSDYIKKEEDKPYVISKDEELIINIEELADELAEKTLSENKDNTLSYKDLLEKYKIIILKHERKQKEC